MKKRNFWKIPMAVFAVFTAICVAAIPITNYFAPMINVALNAETQRIIPDPDARSSTGPVTTPRRSWWPTTGTCAAR